MRPIPLLLCSFALAFLAVDAIARGLLVSPSQIGLVGAAGSTITETIYVSSSREEKNYVQVAISDFVRTIDGELREASADDVVRSCKDWIDVDQNSFTSPEQGRVQLTLTARIPANAQGSYWALLSLRSVPPSRTGPAKGHGFRVVPRIAIPVLVTVTGTEKREMTITDFKVTSVADGVVDVEAVLENRGNVAVLFNGAFTLDRVAPPSEIIEVAEVPVEILTSLPGHKSRVKGRLEWKGALSDLRAHSMFRYGPNANDVAEATAEIPRKAQ
jgi:hypothetical protein